MFASAPSDDFWFLNLNLCWTETCPLVRPVAKGLALRTSAPAPPVFARLNFLNDGRFLKNFCFAHEKK